MKMIRVGYGFLLAAFVLLTACGGDKPPVTPIGDTAVTPIGVTLSPPAVTMDQGATLQFTATVTGTTNPGVLWSVQEGSSGGSISAGGVYTAPAAAGVFHVLATSAADSSKTATAAVTVNSVGVSVSPSSGDLEPGASYQFVATVTGSVNRNVTWTVTEGVTGGLITNNGVYTAPATPGTFHIMAISVADRYQTATVTVNVATLAVAITPRSVGLMPGGTRTFTATVAGSMDDRVTWLVQEGSAGGVITSEGLYTAPVAVGDYHIIATSVAHPSVSAIAKVIVSDSGFTSTGDMTQTRFGHTATLLQNGNVLLVGGRQSEESWEGTATAEIFDHTAGAFRAIDPMQAKRFGHTATRLADGKVLIAGGWSPWASTNSAELFDPATGKFTPTGPMGTSRAEHTATLLADKKVLITGGFSGFWGWDENYLNGAELYDPATGTFTPTGFMNEARMLHSATLLADGRVLITGGFENTAELYSPTAGTFAYVGSFEGRRTSQTTTLLADGRVLLAGGERDLWSDTPDTYDDAQIFNPATGQFSFLAQMNAYRGSHTATLLRNDQVLIVGGLGSNGTAESTAELFDPSSSTFLITGSMANPRMEHTATLLPDGRVLVAGGTSDKSAEIYTPLP